jgi:hypothetical protein
MEEFLKQLLVMLHGACYNYVEPKQLCSMYLELRDKFAAPDSIHQPDDNDILQIEVDDLEKLKWIILTRKAIDSICDDNRKLRNKIMDLEFDLSHAADHKVSEAEKWDQKTAN